jgi:S-formylglutathione hydrolase FrmB
MGAVVLALVGLVVVPVARAESAQLTFADAAGIQVESVTQLSSRQYNVSVSSAALGRAVDVRVLVPADYSEQAPARLPVLYLFHGTSGRASDWVNTGEAVAATADLPLIVVMPDAGFDGNGGGWFTNWVDTHTALGPSQWETFHIDQLIPWVDANLRTIADRDGRAVAGLSQGGFGSTTYAARHPDQFVSVASFSGAPDIDYNPAVAVGATAVIQATAVGLNGTQPDAMFGPRATHEINWQGHDPATLVSNLRGMDVWLYTATGAPGPYDPSVPNPGSAGIEALTHGSTISFVQRAQDQGVPVHLEDYVLGSHSWPYWARDLRQYLAPLMQTFSHPPPATPTVSYQSIDRSWSQWGWSVSLERPALQQLSYLTDAGAQGFTLQGTGLASVVTPAFYPPRAVAVVTLAGQRGSSTLTVTADADGRLHLSVPLGGAAVPGVVGGAAVIGVPTAPVASGTTKVAITLP